jgi:hypothetical protein
VRVASRSARTRRERRDPHRDGKGGPRRVGLDTDRPEGYLLLGELNLLRRRSRRSAETFTAARAKAARARPDFLQEPSEVRILRRDRRGARPARARTPARGGRSVCGGPRGGSFRSARTFGSVLRIVVARGRFLHGPGAACLRRRRVPGRPSGRGLRVASCGGIASVSSCARGSRCSAIFIFCPR